MSIKEKIKSFFSFKEHKKLYSFVAAAIIVLSLFNIWLFFTPTGELVEHSFFKTFNNIPEEHIIEIYSGNEKIKELDGFYRIEQYHGYIVIINEQTGERVDVYGASVIVNSQRK